MWRKCGRNFSAFVKCAALSCLISYCLLFRMHTFEDLTGNDVKLMEDEDG